MENGVVGESEAEVEALMKEETLQESRKAGKVLNAKDINATSLASPITVRRHDPAIVN